jgi:Bacterial regulatory proteins, tetR family
MPQDKGGRYSCNSSGLWRTLLLTRDTNVVSICLHEVRKGFTMALSRRERRHEQTRQEIKQVARQQMAQQGTAASLSLRGIAASMGMSAPSLYNYYSNRDDLALT